MHFNFIPGATCLPLGMVAVNQPKVHSTGDAGRTSPASKHPPSSVPPSACVLSLRKCFAIPGAGDGGKYSLGHLTVAVKLQGWDRCHRIWSLGPEHCIGQGAWLPGELLGCPRLLSLGISLVPGPALTTLGSSPESLESGRGHPGAWGTVV